MLITLPKVKYFLVSQFMYFVKTYIKNLAFLPLFFIYKAVLLIKLQAHVDEFIFFYIDNDGTIL